MSTQLNNILNELFESQIRSMHDMDKTDISYALKAFLRDNCYDIYEINECLLNKNILNDFENEHSIDIYDDKTFKKMFPHYKRREALICLTELFIEFIASYPNDIRESFTNDFCKIFFNSVDYEFDEIINTTYGRHTYSNQEDFEYQIFCNTKSWI